ncbi:hypothetical protein K456DRAFT_42463 [Colletotrichum gloeosporioides 23]|nr:hypothetical protein K456DRAFT_42463 [Colletotrichum gloeosporioides 23]
MPQSPPSRPPKRLKYTQSYIGNTPYPVTIKDVDVSSIAGNGSEYLLDAGLWTACRDSREAMKKKWKEVKRERGYCSIAFEFDSSWAFDPSKKTIAELRQTPGPRACFLNLLMDMTARSEDDERGEAFETLSLVDRSVLRRPDCRNYWGERVFHAQNRKFGRVYDPSDVVRGSSTASMNALEFLNILKEELPHLWVKIRCDIAVFARNSKLKSKPRPNHRPKRVKTGKVWVERI